MSTPSSPSRPQDPMKSAERKKTGQIREEDVSNLLHRYSAQKVLALLQEVSQSADAKMDWDALVKNTATGITSAREYQMLWRHIAYFGELLENVEDGAEPLDDDSDLEYELEAYPPVSAEASAEAAACVKVLSGAVLSGDSKVPNGSTVEAPLTINIPNGLSSKSSLKNSLPVSIQGTNITVPVSVQKQLAPAGAAGEGPDANGSTSTILPPRKKRKPWTEDEDLELLAAVDKCGEGNWQNILKGDFKGNRTASQLSQRWAIIKKRKSNPSAGGQGAGPQLSSALLATRQAINIALKDTSLTVGSGAATSSNHGALHPSNVENAVVNNALSQPQQSQSNPAVGNPISSKSGTSSSIPNPGAPPKKAPLRPLLNTDSSVVAKVAVAPGARLANSSEAATTKEENAVVNNTHSQTQQSQSKSAGGNPISSKSGTSLSIPNQQAPPKKAPLKPLLNTDFPMVAKVAVTAGARLANSSEAATTKEQIAVVHNACSQTQQSQSNPAGGSSISAKPGTSSSVLKPRAPLKKAPLMPVSNTDSSMVAGAHLAKPSEAVSTKDDNAVAVNTTLSQPQQSQSSPAGGNPISSKPATSSSILNPRAPPQKAPLKPGLNTESFMLAKAAVAAGARLAKPAEAATFLKATQANNAVHIMPIGGNTLIKSSVTGPSNPTPSSLLGPNRTTVRANLVKPNTPPTSSAPISNATGSQPVRRTFMRPPVVLPAPSPKVSTSSKSPNNPSAPLSQPNKVEAKKEEKTSQVMKAPPLPPQPLARPVSTTAEVIAPSISAARENSQSAVISEKDKAGIVTVVVNVDAHNSGGDLKNNNGSLAEGKQENSPSLKVGDGATSELRSEATNGAGKSEKKEQ